MKKYYYKISEASKILDVNQSTLRFWEKEFKELKLRNNKSRNRRYTPKQLEILKEIKRLLYIEKYTIEGAKRQLSKKRRGENIQAYNKDELIRKLIKLKKMLNAISK